jgi:hypothetical protein
MWLAHGSDHVTAKLTLTGGYPPSLYNRNIIYFQRPFLLGAACDTQGRMDRQTDGLVQVDV